MLQQNHNIVYFATSEYPMILQLLLTTVTDQGKTYLDTQVHLYLAQGCLRFVSSDAEYWLGEELMNKSSLTLWEIFSKINRCIISFLIYVLKTI